jgi:hypothetical protein
MDAGVFAIHPKKNFYWVMGGVIQKFVTMPQQSKAANSSMKMSG